MGFYGSICQTICMYYIVTANGYAVTPAWKFKLLRTMHWLDIQFGVIVAIAHMFGTSFGFAYAYETISIGNDLHIVNMPLRTSFETLATMDEQNV